MLSNILGRYYFDLSLCNMHLLYSKENIARGVYRQDFGSGFHIAKAQKYAESSLILLENSVIIGISDPDPVFFPGSLTQRCADGLEFKVIYYKKKKN